MRAATPPSGRSGGQSVLGNTSNASQTHLKRTSNAPYYTILCCTIPYYTVLYYTILYYLILYCIILIYLCIVLYNTIPYPGRPRGAAGFEGGHASQRKVRGAERSGQHLKRISNASQTHLKRTLLYYTILCCTIPYYTVQYYTILYYLILYCIILIYLCIVLYNTIPYPGRPRGAAGFEGGHASQRKVRGAERSG